MSEKIGSTLKCAYVISLQLVTGKGEKDMNRLNLKKLAAAGMLTAIAVVLSSISIPVGASRCYPVQHLINVMAGVFLGPLYGVSMAFCTSLIRNLMGTGSLLAFPGSMVGAFLCGMLYKKTGHLSLAYLGEILGTGVLGALLCYPVAVFFMGKETAVFAYVIPFLMSTAAGTCIAAVLTGALNRSGAMDYMKRALEVHAV
ncbi:energy coupling factor transporter S component ThiW [Lachnotalea sp. AF33-28]|nr:energy coupling factor transporter S component ThiW [Lachnotalea sp. AF33-28]